MIKLTAVAILLLLFLYAAVTQAAGKRVERQQYRTVKETNGIEIRYYPKVVLATVSSDGNSFMSNSSSSFRTLAGYIFGGNKNAQKIAMTAPVHIERESSSTKMSFVMPSNVDFDDLPQPNDTTVLIHYSKEGYYAVIKFGGYGNDNKIKKKISELKVALDLLQYEIIGDYSYLGYNAPWDVIGRENEIIVQIDFSEI